MEQMIIDSATEIADNGEVNTEKDYILEVDGLKQYFPVAKDFFGKPLAFLRAVDGVSFKLERGKTLGVVVNPDAEKPPLEELFSDSMT